MLPGKTPDQGGMLQKCVEPTGSERFADGASKQKAKMAGTEEKERATLLNQAADTQSANKIPRLPPQDNLRPSPTNYHGKACFPSLPIKLPKSI
jgi:hypothetical protein